MYIYIYTFLCIYCLTSCSEKLTFGPQLQYRSLDVHELFIYMYTYIYIYTWYNHDMPLSTPRVVWYRQSVWCQFDWTKKGLCKLQHKHCSRHRRNMKKPCYCSARQPGWWFEPLWKKSLKKMKVNWDDEIPNIYQYMGKCQKWQPNHQPATVCGNWTILNLISTRKVGWFHWLPLRPISCKQR